MAAEALALARLKCLDRQHMNVELTLILGGFLSNESRNVTVQLEMGSFLVVKINFLRLLLA